MAQRTERLQLLGANEVHPLVPTKELLSQSPREFVKSMVERFNVRHFVEGNDFHFGKGRAGSIDTLRALEGELGHDTIVVPPVEAALADMSIVRASSSLIRWLLGHGRVRDAAMLLGRPYELRCEVVKGDQRGRAIGFPTANLAHGDMLLPADGIYCGRGTIERNSALSFPAAISIGTKPTFGNHPRTCEAHLVGFDGALDDYGWKIRLEFHDWLRDQLVYPEVEALIEQLHRDVDQVRRHVASLRPLSPIPCDAPA